MAPTLEDVISCGKITVNKLKYFETLANKVKVDPTIQSKLIASRPIVEDIYQSFTKLQDEYLFSEDTFSSNEQLDSLYQKILDIYVLVGAQQLEIEAKGTTAASSSLQCGDLPSKIRLPPLQIQPFSGDFKKWPSFIGLFNSLIHNNLSLSNIEKFQYLLSYLSGEPYKLVQSLPVTVENYPIAYEQLCDRFENKRLLVSNYWKSLYNAPSVVENDNGKSLRHLLNIVVENLAALELVDGVDLWNFTVFKFVFSKLDPTSKMDFELHNSGSGVPEFSNLKSFIESRCIAFETAAADIEQKPRGIQKPSFSGKKSPVSQRKFGEQKPKNLSSFVANTDKGQLSCCLCRGSHTLIKCDKFLEKDTYARYAFAKENRLCLKCLLNTHVVRSCTKSSCNICHKDHSTLLHFPKADNSASNPSNVVESNASNPSIFSGISNTSNNSIVLLSTVVAEVRDNQNRFQKIRILLDSGSQCNFITEACLKRLGLKRTQLNMSINGINSVACTATNGKTECTIRPIDQPALEFDIHAAVLSQICSNVPSSQISPNKWEHIVNLRLADPTFDTPSKIDMLLGAQVFPLVLYNGRLQGNINEPVAMNTVFGWVLMGQATCQNSLALTSLSLHSTTDMNLDLSVQKFWELEQVPKIIDWSPDEIQCEKTFVDTYTRHESGRYIVKLPFKNSLPLLGDSYKSAMRRFLLLESKLLNNSNLRKSYLEFMDDYFASDHMSLVSETRSDQFCNYYIPHHAVFKPDSSTTKLRVVFDASAKSTNSKSLNVLLWIGPKLQLDIATILLSFRSHRYVMTADVKQMYRQILIHPDDRDYQRILWRSDPSQIVKEFRLNTVTYGVSSAPYLALRTIQQLAADGAVNYPLASKVLRTDIYVDDVVTGSDSLEEALELQAQLISLFESAGFALRKWASNTSLLLSNVSASVQTPLNFEAPESDVIKILGLQWKPTSDSFSFKVEPIERPCTKRNLLSELARIYDPLGFLAPLTLFAKHLIQTLWVLGLSWDDKPPDYIVERWATYKRDLSRIVEISIPRYISSNSLKNCELHAFCDASQIGFASVVYFRFESANPMVLFVMARTKVAPLKLLSIPRLELSAAVLLSELVAYIVNLFEDKLNIVNIYAWSDSTIALHWIKAPPYQWKTFIANRVNRIQERVPPDRWYHIRGSENPADCASRGLLPADLVEHPLWWAGPSWLSLPKTAWPCSLESPVEPLSDVDLEERAVVSLAAHIEENGIQSLIQKFSSFGKIQRIVAYLARFSCNCRDHLAKNIGPLSHAELYGATIIIVRYVQSTVFSQELTIIRKNGMLPKPLRKLALFVDNSGVLRVGGRLRNSDLSFDEKHPLLLPRSHRLTDLLVEHFHRVHLHPGPQTLLFLLSQQFWILGARYVINSIISRCYRCFRVKPTPFTPLMGDLPVSRVSGIKAFLHTGVDFAGPFWVTQFRTRGAKRTKAYISLFVCMATKALHLELVSDLTSEAFIAALRRFVSRRGHCSDLYSDCGTNFVGANRILASFCERSSSELTIKWHFNPPSAPHFGGLWEAGVKSVKTHLIRVVGDQILTFEEFSTVLTQIEATLNSRPLCSFSPDPNDLAALTPGHFLTVDVVSSVPDPDLSHLKLNRLTRWQVLQKIHQDFWKRWRAEYLHSLQQRQKWTSPSHPPKIGTLVVIQDDNTPFKLEIWSDCGIICR